MMMMWIIRGSNIIHPIRTPTLRTPSNGMFPCHQTPLHHVAIGRETGASCELFVAEGFHADGIRKRAFESGKQKKKKKK